LDVLLYPSPELTGKKGEVEEKTSVLANSTDFFKRLTFWETEEKSRREKSQRGAFPGPVIDLHTMLKYPNPAIWRREKQTKGYR
jgi:hypothetical protein